MSHSVHPALRARQDVAIVSGILQDLSSDGVIRQKNAEAAGLVTRPMPVEGAIIFNNTSWQPSTIGPTGVAVPGATVAI